VVEIRSFDEICSTLDESGCFEGLPFMPEMSDVCGQRAVVFRCVDKIYDYGRTKKLRRLSNTVLLAGLRCNGSAHGGCQAGCYVLWKTVWLRPVGSGSRSRSTLAREHAAAAVRPSGSSSARYTCQYTELAAASSPLATWDIRQDLRPLMTGNLTLRAFCVGMLTRWFNAVQDLRGGAGYPAMTRGSRNGSSLAAVSFVRGDRVRVRSAEDILTTLNDEGRHRGLWFDRDMVKHCGQRYTIADSVERIIDDATGRMLHMKTPCLVLAGADASGEFLRFCAQHEYPFWRDVWLSPEPDCDS